ncbi:Peptidoglycan O-acetyltransferase [Posidoniimonas polymericola]|uniref:Peptidoglycan O-acetyltransferase n=1 Tax=Posidoniimonas polymericola TaxID=2528002 RepID=A0A5C5ZDJ0_9BACT|nr:MBOAT family protein [Posidoniimonas polymericola]TWT85238.1 Peptidoglycan O-acetyltransferase [Posidoniimonas polymericola]
MLFVEPTFLFVFLPLVVMAYALCPLPLRNALLLGASLVFYALGEKEYVAVMIGSIGANYLLGLAIDRVHGSPWATRALVAATVAVNLAPLVYFKYAGFIAQNTPALDSGIVARLASTHLPIGISFFTFQGLSYVLDVAARRTRPQRNPLDLGLYIALFPQLIAGPIVRYTQLRDQLHGRLWRFSLMAAGSRRFVIGAAKKLLIANPMAEVADGVFSLPADELGAPLAWTGAIAYTFQIYFDFSGYSDMAVGLGRLFGFRIPRNFNYPYISRSITEFWRRWHISLSSWFRDYVYIPLGGNRGGEAATYRNLLIVFLLCGLWHGAGWGFILWGAYHGLFLIAERAGLGRLLSKMPAPIGWAYAMLGTVIGWILFRASTGPTPEGDAFGYFLGYLGAMFGLTGSPGLQHTIAEFVFPAHLLVFFAAAIACTPILLVLTRAAARTGRRPSRAAATTTLHAAVYGVLAVLVTIRAASDAYNPFIYFQF